MTDYERAQLVWPGIGEREFLSIGPLGSRPTYNTLVFNRRTGEVFTGWRTAPAPEHPCYLGTLDEFEAAVSVGYPEAAEMGYRVRWGIEYREAIRFLRSLPPVIILADAVKAALRPTPPS